MGENPVTIPASNKGAIFTSYDVDAFEVPSGRDEAWRFTPMRRLRGLHDGTATPDGTATVTVTGVEESDGVTVETVGREDARLGTAGAPADRVAAQAYTSFEAATVVTIGTEAVPADPVVVTVTGPGSGKTAFGHLQLRAQRHSRAVVILDQRGAGTYAENVEILLGDGADLTVVAIQDWSDDAVHVGSHHLDVGRDAKLTHMVVTLGGELVRIAPTLKYSGPGGSADLWGVYFADDGQHFEQHLLVDHAQPHCRSNVVYKGALQGDPASKKPDARTVWIGDVLIRAEAEGTDTYELNRNLVLTDGARADSVPNLEIETGEIRRAGHASTTGRFDDEQLFYLRSRGIPEREARQLVVRGFFHEIIDRIPVEVVRARLSDAIEAELAAAGS
ncbi:Fe-S cluster assembly protein SufD [Tomitella fengzijianii]|uniref:Fe-S cluster assembly protein SufD n=1 Tax=Tomitella fengzijianii TaxID=2597660 RepID=A0A516X840_9ACTN|nr:Fe-S cluster assembly protein SufD [Tomitella fengzijianii]QDQ99193.1 Fe-S cluster assembly protein SufD [Tomitella fengzijianii]